MPEPKQPSPYSEPGGLLPHCQPGEIRGDERYWDKGWYFSRMKEGWVHIRLKWGTTEASAMIPPDAWAAILDHVGTPEQAIAEICRSCGCMEFNR